MISTTRCRQSLKTPRMTPPSKLNFSTFGDIFIRPRAPEVPHFRYNRFRAEDHGFDPHQGQFFSREKRHERGIFYWSAL